MTLTLTLLCSHSHSHARPRPPHSQAPVTAPRQQTPAQYTQTDHEHIACRRTHTPCHTSRVRLGTPRTLHRHRSHHTALSLSRLTQSASPPRLRRRAADGYPLSNPLSFATGHLRPRRSRTILTSLRHPAHIVCVGPFRLPVLPARPLENKWGSVPRRGRGRPA